MKYPYQVSDDLIRNRESLGIDGSDVVAVLSEGRSQRSSAKTKDFFDLDLMNSKSNSYKMTIHFEYLPLVINMKKCKSWGSNMK